MWAVSLETSSLKFINSNKYLFISISVFWALLIWICTREFDWLWDTAKLVFQLAKQKPDPQAWWFHQGNAPLLQILWSKWLFWTHLSYAHICLLRIVNNSHWCFKLEQPSGVIYSMHLKGGRGDESLTLYYVSIMDQITCAFIHFYSIILMTII